MTQDSEAAGGAEGAGGVLSHQGHPTTSMALTRNNVFYPKLCKLVLSNDQRCDEFPSNIVPVKYNRHSKLLR